MQTTTKHKLAVLARVADLFNQNGLKWAVGASLLLYLKGMVPDFNDIDIMLARQDVDAAQRLLGAIGTLQPPNPSPQYATEVFLEYTIDGVDFDLIAGFCIIKNGKKHPFPLEGRTITEHAYLGDTPIPLQAVEDWKEYYTLMGRTDKVALIERHTAAQV